MAPKQALRALLAVSEEYQKRRPRHARREWAKTREGVGREGRLGGEKSAQVAQNVNVNK